MRRFIAPVLVTAALACGSDNPTPIIQPPPTPPVTTELTDAALSALARASTGWTYFKNRPDTLLRSVQSGHAEARLRTRFNAKAAALLDANGKVRAGASFPDSSLVVKELLIGGTLNRYAVMYKQRASTNAGTGGWLWAYYAPDGSTQIGIAGRGAACQGCHSAGIDHVRMNDSHP